MRHAIYIVVGLIVVGLAVVRLLSPAIAASSGWPGLVRPRMNARMSYALHPPKEQQYPDWAGSICGYAQGGETGITAVAWIRCRYSGTSEAVIMPMVMGSCTAEAARATRDGGAGLTNLVTGTLTAAQDIELTGGTWAAQCLRQYEIPDETLAAWQYGCYCINVTTDTPLTLSVADTEINIPVTNNMVRNVMGSSASRWVVVTAQTEGANVKFGIAEMPLHQFVSAQSDPANPYGSQDEMNGGIAETWRMCAFRARIESGKMIAMCSMYTPAAKCTMEQCVTQSLWRARQTFERDAMVRIQCASFAPELFAMQTTMAKLFHGWLAEAEVERIRDVDVAEMQRHGAEFPEIQEDYRFLKLTPTSTYEQMEIEDEGVTNGCQYTYVGARRITSRAAIAEVVNGVNYKGPFGPADYEYTCTGATMSNNVAIFPSAGKYTVRATDPAGTFVTNVVTAGNQSTSRVTRLEYRSDAYEGAGFNARVATWLMSATNDGVKCAYNTKEYYKWKARRLHACPSECGNWQGRSAKHAITPHVMASAKHWWGWPAYEMTFTDPEGNSAVVRQDKVIHANDWALANGFTQEQVAAADLGDLVFVTVRPGDAIPEGCCPYMMSAETWRRVVKGPFGTLGWCATQTDLGWGLPVLFKADISTNGGGYGAKWTWAAGFPFQTATSAEWAGASSLMPAELFEGWEVPEKFAPTYGGDSGLPLFLEDGDGKMILVSCFHTVTSGTCYPRAFEIVRAFCASQGDTLKEWTEE